MQHLGGESSTHQPCLARAGRCQGPQAHLQAASGFRDQFTTILSPGKRRTAGFAKLEPIDFISAACRAGPPQ